MNAQPIETTDTVKTITPIAFWKTRSFWFGWFPALLTIVNVAVGELMTGQVGPVSEAIFFVVGHFLPVTARDISDFMVKIAPLYALIVAQQRAGLSRPYAIDASKENSVLEMVENGKTAFDAGKAIGQALRKK